MATERVEREITEAGKGVIFERPEVVRFSHSPGAALICIVHERSGSSGALLVGALGVGGPELGALISGLLRLSGAKREELRFKLLGGGEGLASARELLRGQGLEAHSELDLGGSPLEAFFFSDTGRLRARLPEVTASTPSLKRRVLVIDDSGTIRQLLRSILSEDPGLEIAGMAATAEEGEALIERARPDVITLDLNMPGAGGLGFLERVLPRYAIPTLVISSLSRDDGDAVMRALELGAFDYVQKPTQSELPMISREILAKVRLAAGSRKRGRERAPQRAFSRPAIELDPERILAFGASTGGIEALSRILSALPERIPPVVVAQHIPAAFSEAVARFLAANSPFVVKEAEDGEPLEPGKVLLAPGGRQLRIAGAAPRWRAQVCESEPCNGFAPSVDVLFESVAKAAGSSAIAALLTGMGDDGARGLLRIREAGGRTIAQDESSCVVFGMPRVAIQIGAAERVCSLGEIAIQIQGWAVLKKSA